MPSLTSFSVRLAALALCLTAGPALSAPDPVLRDQALETLKRGIAFRTVAGAGQTAAYAAYLKGVLLAAGYRDSDILIEPMNGTAFLIARYPGTDPTAKPLVINGHMDVVEAKAADWTRDPFTPVIENGYIYGRGATDNKFDVSAAVTVLGKLRREGWKPRREVILALSGDEETLMATTAELALRLKNAELVLNVDGGGGGLLDGKPVAYGIQGAEKTYADFTLTVTDPGGHSSRPTPGNAIYRLAQALSKVQAYAFPVQFNDITRGAFAAAARNTPGPMGAAMAKFAAHPTDAAAIATLSADLSENPSLRTTCVATQLSGGHAPNALPQRAEATVNCRIFPGTSSENVRQTLAKVIEDPSVSITRQKDGAIDAPASPLRADVMAAVSKAVHARYPGLPIVPLMESGATDSMYFRAAGIPSYGISGMFTQSGDSFVHGLNERAPLSTLDGALAHYDVLFRELAK